MRAGGRQRKGSSGDQSRLVLQAFGIILALSPLFPFNALSSFLFFFLHLLTTHNRRRDFGPCLTP